jgi:ribosomal protein S7
MKEQKIKQDIQLAFQTAIFNLIPVLSVSNIKRGKRIQVLPVLLKPQRRMVLINK